MTRTRSSTKTAEKEALILKLALNRRLAHAVLFRHRHPQTTPEFHGIMIDDFHDRTREKVVTEAFRDGAKSTIGEEGVCLRAGFREFKNCIVVGASEERAMERVEAIKYELETNEDFAEVFGNLRGAVWSGHKAEIPGGIIQAIGVGQSLRGTKYRQYRPDFCLIDDIEDDDSVRDAEARTERLRWLYKTLLPALAKGALVRLIGNRLDNDAVIAKVARDPDWTARKFPIRYRDMTSGEWAASWPAMFDLPWIEKSRASYARQGLLADWDQEYMCEADVPDEAKVFKQGDMRVRPRARTWEATYAMYDPARTKTADSATTGKAVWSWVGNKLVVWSGFARKLMPDEIIKDLFATDAEFHPIHLGFEEDGLNEWALQPIRLEMVRRGHALPLKPVKAPRGKIAFIKGLQNLFAAGLVEFAFDDPETRQQFLNFPREPIDFPNALAYALKLAPGQPIYEDFTEGHVAEDLEPAEGAPLYLAMNASRGHVTGALVQYASGLRVLADWVLEGEPATVAAEVLARANLKAERGLKLLGPPAHFDKWSNLGLRQALARVPADLGAGRDPVAGRVYLRSLMRQQARGVPLLQVSTEAQWTLNALAGGYARQVLKGGLISEQAEEGPYRTLMEGVESLAALLSQGVEMDEEAEGARFAVSRDGRRYRSAMPARS